MACGAGLDEIEGLSFPSEVASLEHSYQDGWLAYVDEEHRDREGLAAFINDDLNLTDNQRLEKLRPIFASMNPPRRIVWRPKQ